MLAPSISPFFILFFKTARSFSCKALNVLPKNPDNTRKNDYEEQDLEQTKNSRQSSLSRNEVREGGEKVTGFSCGSKT